MNKIKLFSTLIILISVIGCSPSELMLSSATTNQIIIDGNHKDWDGKLKYFEDDKVAVGFQNDKENLYFCIVSSDKSNVMKILSLGLTTWFYPQGNEQVLGLQYPKRMDRVPPQNLMGKNRNKNDISDLEVTIKAMLQNQGEFAIVDDDNEIIYASPVGSNNGYKIKANAVNRQFVYEAKIPIGNNTQAQIPINIFPNEKIRIEFESGEVDMDELRNNSKMRNNEMYGGGEGMRGNMQRGGGRGNSRMGMERFKLEVDVILAK